MTTDVYTLDSAGQLSTRRRLGTRLDHTLDFTAWLAHINDTLAEVEIDAINCTVDQTYWSPQGLIVVWVVVGAEVGEGKVECTITTAGGRIEKQSIVFKIRR